MNTVWMLDDLLKLGAGELHAALEGKDTAITTFQKIDSFLFREILNQDEFQGLDSTVLTLGVHSRRMWTAAVRMALSGQPYAVPPVARTALEAACYAYLISKDQSLASAWLDRHVDEQSMKRSRKAFRNAVPDATKRLNAVAPGLGDHVSGAYKQCIDDGAHPNTGGIPRTSKVMVRRGIREAFDQTDDFYRFQSKKTQYAILSITSIGIQMCYVLSLTFKTIAEIPPHDLNELHTLFDDLIAAYK